MATVAEISCVHVQADRRAALLGLAAVPAMLSAKPAEAAYGDAANVFGKTVNTSGALTRGSARDVPNFLCLRISDKIASRFNGLRFFRGS